MEEIKKIDCPLEVWLNAKICLPQKKRGLAIGKLSKENNDYSLLLSCDRALLGDIPDQKNNLLFSFNFKNHLQTAIDNLANLYTGTIIMLAPPKIYGEKFWIARINKLLKNSCPGSENTVIYSLLNISRLENFLESRASERVNFRTAVFLIDTENLVSKEYFTYDISTNGLSLIIEKDNPNQNCFEENKDYLLQIQLHESNNALPPLRYTCIHIRNDVITNSRIIGFKIADPKAQDPKIKDNLGFLTWSLDNTNIE